MGADVEEGVVGPVPADVLAAAGVVGDDPPAAVVQVAGCLDGRWFHWTSGVDVWGAPAHERTTHNLFCSGKPLLAMVVLDLLEQRGLTLRVPLRQVVAAGCDWLPGDVTVGEVLRHEAGMLHPDALTWRLHEPDERGALLRRDAWEGRSGGYSSLAGWLALEEVVAHLTGREPARHLQDVIEGAWGLPDVHVHVPGGRGEAVAHLSAPRVAGGRGTVPLLSEVLPRYVEQVQPALGCLASAAGLARFYRLVGRVLAGEAVPAMPSSGCLRMAWSDGALVRDDPVLGRRTSFAFGVMRDLHLRFGSGRLGPRTVGHTGGFCTSVGLFDPDQDLALALVLGVSVFDQARYDVLVGTALGAVLAHLGC